MLKNRIMVGAAVAAAAIVPIAGVSALAASPAGAAVKPGIDCASVTGSANATTMVAKLSFKSCTPSTKTGGSGKSTGSATSTSGTITWTNGKKTSFSEATSTGTLCASGNVADEVITGNVTSDNTKATTVGAAVSGEICATVTATGKIKLKNAPGVHFHINGV